MNEQISRRPPEHPATRPFERIAIDIVQLIPTGQSCYNGDKYLLHAVCQFSKWHEGETLPPRGDEVIVPAVYRIIEKIQRQFGYKYIVLVVRSDNERGWTKGHVRSLRDVGMKVERTPADTDEPKGLQESAGKSIMTRTRALRIASDLPQDLVNELTITAIQLLNTTPTRSNQWRTPYEVIYGYKPTISHYAPIGCRAYMLNRDLDAADKTSSRVHIGYLLGYDSTNIFRVWIHHSRRVIRTRDVIFKHDLMYKDDLEHKLHAPKVAEEEIDILDLTMPEEQVTADDLYTPEQTLRYTQELSLATESSDQPSTPPTRATSTNKSPQQMQLLTPDASRMGTASPPQLPEDSILSELSEALASPTLEEDDQILLDQQLFNDQQVLEQPSRPSRVTYQPPTQPLNPRHNRAPRA